MVRLALLGVLAVALFAAGPAQANPLTQTVETTVAGTLQQVTSTAASVTPAATAAVPATADTAVRAVGDVTRTVSQTTGPASEPAVAAAQSTVSSAQAAATPVTAPPPATPSSSPRAPDFSPRALSSTRDRGPARALRAGRDRADSQLSSAGPHAGAARPTAPADVGVADFRAADARPADATHPREPRAAGAPDRDRGQGGFAPASGVASAVATGLFCGGLALLAGMLCLAGPRLTRRLSILPVAHPPAVFASTLERPG